MADSLEEALALALTASNDTVNKSNWKFIIDNDFRTIEIPEDFTFGVYLDRNVQTIDFEMPKMFRELDMSNFSVEIKYVSNEEPHLYSVSDKRVDGDKIRFSWTVNLSGYIENGGTVLFAVCLRVVDNEATVTKEFNTTIHRLTVLPGLEDIDIDPAVEDEVKDYLALIQELVFRTETAAENAADSEEVASEKASQASAAAATATAKATAAASSATSAANSASAASTSATSAANSATAAAESETNAAESAANSERSAQDAEESVLATVEAMGKPEVSVSGSFIETFDALPLPAKSAVLNFEPIQDLHGYDRPWAGGVGKNKFDSDNLDHGTIGNDGLPAASNDRLVTQTPIDVSAFSTLTLSYTGAGITVIVALWANGTLLSRTTGIVSGATIDVSNADEMYICFYKSNTTLDLNDVTNIQLEEGNQVTSYEPYSNICPVSGREEVEVKRTGKNLLRNTLKTVTTNGITYEVRDDGTIAVTGTATSTSQRTINKSLILQAGTYILNGMWSGGSSTTRMLYINANGGIIARDTGSGASFTLDTETTVTILAWFASGQTVDDVIYPMLCLASETDAAFEPYQGQDISIQLGQTVYGGSIDLSTGVLTVTHATITATASNVARNNTIQYYVRPTSADSIRDGGNHEMWSDKFQKWEQGMSVLAPGVCYVNGSGALRFNTVAEYESTADMIADIGEINFVYPLATPTEIQLSDVTRLKLLKGYNRIISDGVLDLTYYIDDFVKEQLQSLLDEHPAKTVTGNPVSVADALGSNAKGLGISLEPIQDLHGYDHPWPEDGGKNKLKVTAVTTTHNGVTYTVNDDGTVVTNGTASPNSYLDVYYGAFKAGNYILTGCPTGGSSSSYRIFGQVGSTYYNDYGSGVSISLSEDVPSLRVRLSIPDGITVTNLLFKPMIRLASEADATFEPYSNICPISGRTEVNVERTGKNLIEFALPFTTNQSGTTSVYATNFVLPRIGYYYRCSGKCLDGTVLYDVAIVFKNSSGQQIENIGTNRANLAKDLSATVSIMLYLPEKYAGKTVTEFQMEYVDDTSSQFTSYEPYHAPQSIQIPFGQTVYGGQVDLVTGKVRVTHGLVDLGTLNWIKNDNGAFYVDLNNKTVGLGDMKCSALTVATTSVSTQTILNYPDYSIGQNIVNSRLYVRADSYETGNALKTALSGVTLYYTLATPIEIQLTPRQLKLLQGTNIIITDADDISLEYYQSFASLIEELRALIEG